MTIGLFYDRVRYLLKKWKIYCFSVAFLNFYFRASYLSQLFLVWISKEYLTNLLHNFSGTGAKMRNRAKRSQSSRAAESYCKSVDVKALLVAYNRQISTSSATKGQSGAQQPVTTPPNNTTEEATSDRPRSWSPSRSVHSSHILFSIKLHLLLRISFFRYRKGSRFWGNYIAGAHVYVFWIQIPPKPNCIQEFPRVPVFKSQFWVLWTKSFSSPSLRHEKRSISITFYQKAIT